MNLFSRKFLPAICSVLWAPALVDACAVCLTGTGDDALTEAFNWSVLFLMATPYTVVGAIVGCLIYAKRGSAANGAKTESDDEPIKPLATIQKGSATR